jgi:type IV pilus biogenesis/stability protein PilW
LAKHSDQENAPGTEQTLSVRILHVFFLFFIIHVVSCATTPNAENIKNAEVHNKLAESYLNKSQFNEAFVELQKALKLNPENKVTLNYLGYVSTQFGKNNDAITYYKQAISVDPDYSEAHNNLGVVYAEIEEWDNAIASFKSALKNPVYRTPVMAYSNMGYVFYRKGEFRKAADSFEEALIRNPISPRTLYLLGLVYIELDNDYEAIENFSKAVGIMPEYIDAHWELANAYLRAGNSDSALKHFNIVVDSEKNTVRSREASEYIELFK